MRQRLFNKRMTVSTLQTTADGIGGAVTAGLPATGIVPCRCEAISGRERLIWRQEGVDISHRLYCAGTINLNTARTVKVDDMEYDVLFVRERGGRTKHLEVDLLELRHGGD